MIMQKTYVIKTRALIVLIIPIIIFCNYIVSAQDTTLTKTEKSYLKSLAKIVQECPGTYADYYQMFRKVYIDSSQYKNVNRKELDEYINLFTGYNNELQNYQFTDTMLNSICKNYFEANKKIKDCAVLLKKAITLARKNKKWKNESSKILKQIAIIRREIKDLTEIERKYISKYPDFMNELTEDIRALYDGRLSELGFEFGVHVKYTEPLNIISVHRSYAANRLGFKENDKIIEINSVKVESLYEFKKIMKDNMGKTIDCKIIRDGKEITIAMEITEDIINQKMAKKLESRRPKKSEEIINKTNVNN